MYIGRKTGIGSNTVLGNNVRIYGPSSIGSNTFVDNNIIIGYPIRSKIISIFTSSHFSVFDEILDELSDGATIGSNVIIRHNTTIYEKVEIAERVEIGHNVVIRENTVIKSGCRIGTGTVVDGHVVVDEDTIIQSCVYIPPGVKIGRNVFIAPRVTFTNDRYPPSRKLIETIVEEGAVIGANAVITPGIVVGRGCVVAAGAVVTKSVKPYTVVAGAPAKPIMDRDEYERKKKDYEEKYVFPYR
ncbi:MAG: DapH/DapD/GlmU-related protein [Ignisphaera sp.]|uniref:N-acetyltransferase n=1 Tax=Ignisphaera aggregans TaxID=334771 RepID=A0A7C4JJK5_9CREN